MRNVKDSPYNAGGLGLTDDTEAIQDAIDDANKDPETSQETTQVYPGTTPRDREDVGEIVLLPKGTYLTTAPLKLPSNVTLQGEGPGTLIKSIFSTEPPLEYDIWRGAIEMKPAPSGTVRNAVVRDLCIFTNMHCGITYDRTKEKWPALVLTETGQTYTDRTAVNNGLFRSGDYPAITDSNHLYIAFTNKTDLIASGATNGLLWTRMKQLGFADEWGTRLELVWQHSAGNDGSGNVQTWTTFTPTAELGGGFWHYGHNGTYIPNFSSAWVAGKVNNSASLYWVRVSTTSDLFSIPELHHIYPGVRVVVNTCTFENLYFNCGNWAIFFGLFTYCQHCTFRGIRTVNNNGGCIWMVGNSNYVSECDTEGGSRSTEGQERTDPGQFTIEGDGNTIRDIIAEGGAGPEARSLGIASGERIWSLRTFGSSMQESTPSIRIASIAICSSSSAHLSTAASGTCASKMRAISSSDTQASYPNSGWSRP